MPLPSSVVGLTIDPVGHEVDARWLMAYAAGIGDLHPRYVDTTRPGGLVAHPLFPVCLEWPAFLELRSAMGATLTRDERVRGVHATHDLSIHRPVVPGDVLSTTATVASVERRAPGAYEVVRLDTTDATGASVSTTYMGSLFRGVDVEGPDRHDDLPPPLPDDEGPEPQLTLAELPVPATAAHVYTECARIWNPIHTDAVVAESAGLPGTILHGTATLAMALSACAVESPRRVTCRFGATVRMPSVLHLTGTRTPDADGVRRFAVRRDDGALAISRGLLIGAAAAAD